MPDEKLRILVIGGDKRNLNDHVLEWTDPYHVEQYDKKIPINAAEDSKAVVVITRWVSHSMFEAGRKFSKSKGIPLIQATTGNYVIAGLVRSGLLPKEAESKKRSKKEEPEQVQAEVQATAPQDQVPTEPVPVPAPAPEVVKEEVQSSGLPPEQLWLLYGTKAVHVIQSALKPGDKVHENDLVELLSMADGVGVPRGDAIHLLSELQAIGAITNVKGKTWRVPNLDVDYDYKTGEVDDEEAEEKGVPENPVTNDEEVAPVLVEDKKVVVPRGKRGRVESKIVWIELLGGLHPGPYRNQQAIWEEALEHVEFSKKDGQPLSRDYYWHLVPEAIEYGVVERLPDGSYVIKPDEKIKLVRRDGKVSGGRVRVEVEKQKPESPEPKKIEAAPAPVLKKKPIPKSGDPVKHVKTHYGGVIPTLDRYTVPTRTLRRMVPSNDWDELAARQIGKITHIQNWRDLSYLKEAFDQSEWDRLACDMIRTLPIEIIMPFLKEIPQDYELHCVECGATFMFTYSEQEFMKQMVKDGKFETFDVPKRCKECRKKAKVRL